MTTTADASPALRCCDVYSIFPEANPWLHIVPTRSSGGGSQGEVTGRAQKEGSLRRERPIDRSYLPLRRPDNPGPILARSDPRKKAACKVPSETPRTVLLKRPGALRINDSEAGAGSAFFRLHLLGDLNYLADLVPQTPSSFRRSRLYRCLLLAPTRGTSGDRNGPDRASSCSPLCSRRPFATPLTRRVPRAAVTLFLIPRPDRLRTRLGAVLM